MNDDTSTIDGTWTYGYDATGELTHAVFVPNSTDPDGITPQDLTYNYDAVGNRTSTVINGVTTQCLLPTISTSTPARAGWRTSTMPTGT